MSKPHNELLLLRSDVLGEYMAVMRKHGAIRIELGSVKIELGPMPGPSLVVPDVDDSQACKCGHDLSEHSTSGCLNGCGVDACTLTTTTDGSGKTPSEP